MAGSVRPCYNNDCPRIDVEQVEGTIVNNTGNVAMVDPDSNMSDSAMAMLNKLQKVNHPGGGDRYDLYTVEQGLHYLQYSTLSVRPTVMQHF